MVLHVPKSVERRLLSYLAAVDLSPANVMVEAVTAYLDAKGVPADKHGKAIERRTREIVAMLEAGPMTREDIATTLELCPSHVSRALAYGLETGVLERKPAQRAANQRGATRVMYCAAIRMGATPAPEVAP